MSSDPAVKNSQEGVQLDGLLVCKETTTPKQPRLQYLWASFPAVRQTGSAFANVPAQLSHPDPAVAPSAPAAVRELGVGGDGSFITAR